MSTSLRKIRSLAESANSTAPYRCCAEKTRTTLYTSASRAWVKLRWYMAWRAVLRKVKYPTD